MQTSSGRDSFSYNPSTDRVDETSLGFVVSRRERLDFTGTETYRILGAVSGDYKKGAPCEIQHMMIGNIWTAQDELRRAYPNAHWIEPWHGQPVGDFSGGYGSAYPAVIPADAFFAAQGRNDTETLRKMAEAFKSGVPVFAGSIFDKEHAERGISHVGK